VVLRDRDTNGGGGWTGASDGTLEARHYYAQNWRADVSGIFDNKGAVLEWVKYSAYGVPHLLTPGDHDKSGEVDKDDETAFNADYGTGNLRADLDEDGDVDADDQALFTASFNKTMPGGRWKLSAADVGNRKGYAGYEHEGFGNDLAATEIAHVRHRVLHFGLGSWTRRDPLGYVDGMNLFCYVMGSPIRFVDSDGFRITNPGVPGEEYTPGQDLLSAA
jgi:RHS repeat-associated protein